MAIKDVIEVIVLGVEIVAVAILSIGVAVVLLRGVLGIATRKPWEQVYEGMRVGMGRALLLGLEVLIAADIIVTVVLELTIANVAALGLLVVIRTFLSWAIQLETAGHWPWQPARDGDPVL